jgi:hypothetical protein
MTKKRRTYQPACPRSGHDAVMAVIMAGKFSLPPSLSRTPSAQASGRKQEARQRAVITAMRSLPLIESAKPEGFVSAFEMTYYDVERKEREAAVPAATVEKQLNHMADKCSDLAKYLGKMHRDTIHEWSRAAGVVGPISIWQLSQILDESASSAEQALKAFKADQRAGAMRGNPGDAMATAMTETAAFVYNRITVKPINQGTKSGSFEAFLEAIFKAYGIEANRQHCIRKLKKSRFWRKFGSRNAISLQSKS